MDKKKKAFIITEAVLLVISAFFMFALIGYRTLALVFLLAAAVVAVYQLLNAVKNDKTSKCLRTIVTVLLLLGVAFFIAVEIPVIKNARTDDDPRSPYLVVLGAGVNGSEPSLSLVERLTAAKEYLEKYPDCVVIVSGGQGAGENITEADCMAQWLTENGISESRIIREEKATSTKENIEYSLEIIKKRGDDPENVLAIVSSEYHLYRARLLSDTFGVDTRCIAAKTTYPVLKLNYFIREAFAVTYFWAFGA